MAQTPWMYAKNSKRDFTRNRKLPFIRLLLLLLGMGAKSLRSELLEFSRFSMDTATTSAFIQQRNKLHSFALEYILHEFAPAPSMLKQYKGYRLLAVDGSDLRLPTNPGDSANFFKSNPDSKGYNLCHLNALFDLSNNIYLDAVIQNGRNANEHKALVDMVDRLRLEDKSIIMADRGYESYNNFAHIERKGCKYLIRVKDTLSKKGILSGLSLPDTSEFDVLVHLVLTRKQTKEVKANPTLYRWLPSNSNFDFLDLDKNLFYPISFRVVRFPISDDSFECVITNLDAYAFPACELKSLYNPRWGIETSFRTLKYNVGLSKFHSKKADFIAQEVFAALIMYNFSAMIASLVIISKNDTCHDYRVNFSNAILVCKRFLHGFVRPPDVEALIRKDTLPVRNGRSFPRFVRSTQAPCFNYR